MSVPNQIYLYRITHINNLDVILDSGLITCPNHQNSDQRYIGIGDSTLIESRALKQVPIVPFGKFSDYVSFYFGARSPMLYNIQNGYKGVTQRTPEEIVYLITTYKEVLRSGRQYVYCDGHGYHNFSQFFNSPSNLNQVDWKTVNLVRWNDTEDDPDRKRRKQAEFLIYQDIPISHIVAFVTYNYKVQSIVLTKLAGADLNINVIVNPKFYYK